MSLRCGCPDEGDDIVFGPCGRCTRHPRFVAGVGLLSLSAYAAALQRTRELRQQDFTLPRYLETLDEAERTGH